MSLKYAMLQDGDIWTFTVRALDCASELERTVSVNYDGFAEGIY